MIETGIDLMNEIIEEDLEVMREVIEEDFMPFIKHRQELEKKIADKAIREMYELEEM